MLSFLRQLTLTLLLTTAIASSNGSKGCEGGVKTSLKPGGPSKSFTFESNAGDGTLMRRRVRIYLPETYESGKPSPLIVALHGKYRNGSTFERVTEFSNPKYNKDAIVLYPDGIDLRWSGDPYAPELSKNNDVKYVGELLDQVESNFCIDKSRIYATGFSNGGGLAHLLACDPKLSSRIAAFAIASGAFFTSTKDRPNSIFDPRHCKPSRSPIPMLESHGDEDDMIHYDGKDNFDGPTYGITDWLKKWADRNKCDFAKGEKTTSHRGRISKYNWDCEGTDKPVLQHYVLHGIGHSWPSVSMLREGEEGSEDLLFFDATPVMKEFFDSHELPAKANQKAADPEEDGPAKPTNTDEADTAKSDSTSGEKDEPGKGKKAIDDELWEERPRDEL